MTNILYLLSQKVQDWKQKVRLFFKYNNIFMFLADSMIKRLANKLKRLGEQLEQANQHLNSGYKQNSELKETNKHLQTQLKLKQMEIEEFEIRFKSLQEQKQTSHIEIVREAPQILRVKEPPLIHTEYKQDPELIRCNQELTLQIEESLQFEQMAKEKVIKLESQNAQLMNKINELESRPPKTVIKERIVVKIERITPPSIAPRLELLFDKYKSYRDDLSNRLVFTCLKMNAAASKFKRLGEQRKDKVMVNQKLEIVDGTYEVFKYMRSTISKWMMSLFSDAMSKANQRHMNSFKLFQVGLIKQKKQGFYSGIMVATYARLKNLIQDDIPSIKWEEKYSYMGKELHHTEKMDLKNFDLEKVKLLRLETDKGDVDDENAKNKLNELEQWVEDTLFCVVIKRRYGDWSRDQNTLFLFRLLAVLYKVELAKATSVNLNKDVKISDTEPMVNDDLTCVLECKVVSALMM